MDEKARSAGKHEFNPERIGKPTPGPLSVIAVEVDADPRLNAPPPKFTETMFEIRRDDGMPIGQAYCGNAVWLHEGEAEANARLWSAAPDMYQSLLVAKEALDCWATHDPGCPGRTEDDDYCSCGLGNARASVFAAIAKARGES